MKVRYFVDIMKSLLIPRRQKQNVYKSMAKSKLSSLAMVSFKITVGQYK